MANSKPGYSVIFSSRVQKEIAHSWQWYEERQQGLGDRFLKQVLDKIKLIEKNPERYPTRYKSYKETPIDVFPFLILYRLNSKKRTINIVSVFHTSLNPRKK